MLKPTVSLISRKPQRPQSTAESETRRGSDYRDEVGSMSGIPLTQLNPQSDRESVGKSTVASNGVHLAYTLPFFLLYF